MHSIERENDIPVGFALEEASIEQRMHIAMDCFDVAPNPARHLADGHAPLPCHGLEELPPLCCQNLPQQFGRGERDLRTLLLAPESNSP
jgi:hypothetical protein